MANQIASLASLMGGSAVNALTPVAPQSVDSGTGSGGGGLGIGGGGGGGTAQDGLGQVNSGASTIANAIGQAQSALGSGGGSMAIEGNRAYKKGGSVTKKYTSGGKINLGACGVSTSSKGKKNSGW